MHAWTIHLDTAALALTLTHPALTLRNVAPAIRVATSTLQASDARVELLDAATCRWTWQGEHAARLTLAFTPAVGGWLRASATLQNLSDQPLAVQGIAVLQAGVLSNKAALDRVYHHGIDMCELTMVYPMGGTRHSRYMGGLTHQAGEAALVLGFERHDLAMTTIELTTEPGTDPNVAAVIDREDIVLNAGTTLDCPALLVGTHPSLSTLLREYASQVGTAMQARALTHPQPMMTGWCSWYHYYGTETAEDIRINARALAQEPWRGRVRVVQIDDGWNRPTADAPRVWGDWEAGAKFPEGMKAIADDIKAQGMIAGLWLAPFSVDPASQLRAQHPEWLVQDEAGQPKDFWGVFGLDLTQQPVLDYLREVFTRVFDVWGFDYIKIDFLLHGIQPGRRADPTQTVAQAYRNGLRVIREVARDRYILTCGSPIGPAIGLADGMRIGYDVSSRWYTPMNLGAWPHGNCAIRPAAYQVLARQWQHGLWWQNDPDCLMTRDHTTVGELKNFSEMAEDVQKLPYGLSDEEAGFWVRLIWLTGGMALLSDRMDEVAGPRGELLTRVFPLNDRPAQWVDWYAEAGVQVLRAEGEPAMIGLFNLLDEPRTVELSASQLSLGARRTMKEWLTGVQFVAEGDRVRFPALPPHGARIWIAE